MIQLLKTGLILLMVAFALWIYEHEFENELPLTPHLDSFFSILGGLMIVIALIVIVVSSIFGKTARWGRKKRCIRCGAKIPKNEMYCEIHKKQVIADYLRGRSPEA